MPYLGDANTLRLMSHGIQDTNIAIVSVELEL